jgi:hypothetical protein
MRRSTRFEDTSRRNAAVSHCEVRREQSLRLGYDGYLVETGAASEALRGKLMSFYSEARKIVGDSHFRHTFSAFLIGVALLVALLARPGRGSKPY